MDLNEVTKLYVMCAALTSLGGIMLAARMNAGQPTASNGLEFDAITATVLGGVAFSGGSGSMPGTILGIFILVAGLSTPLFGVERSRKVLDWWSARGPTLMRVWAGFGLAFGLLLAYAVMP